MILVGLAVPACRNINNRSDEQASELLRTPGYKNLNDSIQLFPKDASLYLRRAIRLTQENAHEQAIADFQKSWSLQPSLENALPFAANLERLLADSYATQGMPAKALQIYNDMITADSLDPETQYEKALLLEQLKDTGGAITALQKAYAAQGVDTYGLELAHLYAEQKNPRALEICNFILKRDSARMLIDPFFIKGIYYANIKQYQKAITEFDSCILRDWKTTDAYLEKGRAYFHMGNFTSAMQTFNMAITVTNTDPDAYFWLARSYEALHRKKEAISNYVKAISLDKGFIEARQRLEKLDTGFARHGH